MLKFCSRIGHKLQHSRYYFPFAYAVELQLIKCEKIRIKYVNFPNVNFSLTGGLHYIFIGKISTIYVIWTT